VENIKSNGFTELSKGELQHTNGGALPVIIIPVIVKKAAVIIGIGAAGFGAGYLINK